MEEILEILIHNNKACRDIIFLYPHVASTLKSFKKSPTVDIIKIKLIDLLEPLREDDEFIKIISKSKSINNTNPVDVRGNVYKINANSDDFKKLIDYANEKNWRYNTFSVLREDTKWLIFFG